MNAKPLVVLVAAVATVAAGVASLALRGPDDADRPPPTAAGPPPDDLRSLGVAYLVSPERVERWVRPPEIFACR